MNAADLKKHMLRFAEEHGLDELTEVYEDACEDYDETAGESYLDDDDDDYEEEE